MIMDRKEKAVAYKHNGCNCAQAVLLGYQDETGLGEDLLRKAGAGFGLGMGNMEGTCGALCGAEMILGLLKYEGRPVSKDAAALHSAFREKCGSTICAEIKGRDTKKILCSCDDCVKNAVEILDKML